MPHHQQQQQQNRAPFQMRESTVPSSRLGRLWHYGGLATGMAFGAVSEGLRRATGQRETNDGISGGGGGSSSLMMSAGNLDRLVAKLSRMRGAALKLGQMMSFQGMWLFLSSVQTTPHKRPSPSRKSRPLLWPYSRTKDTGTDFFFPFFLVWF
jgi:aarF domain-containing kinase